MNIGSLLPRNAQYRPHHTALVFEDCRLTFLELNQRVNRLANALLSLGVTKNDKVATILPNGLELLESYWAIAKIGAVVVPLSQLLRGSGLLNLLRDSDTSTIITNSSFANELNLLKAELENIPASRYISTSDVEGFQSYAAVTEAASSDEPSDVEISDNDPFNIIYSSGTTGQ